MLHNLITIQGSPVPLLKFQIAPRLKLLISSGSKKKEPRCTCLIEAKVSHWQRMWAEVCSSTPHLLHKGLLVSPIKWRSLLRVLCPLRRPITTLGCVLVKTKVWSLHSDYSPKLIPEPASEYYQDLVFLPIAGYPTSILNDGCKNKLKYVV